LRKLRCKRRSDLVALGDPSGWETTSIDIGTGVLDVAGVSLRPRHARFGSLTVAEQEVAAQVVRGATSEEIAKARGTSVHTVQNQVRGIYTKLGVSSRAELVRLLTATGGN